MATKTLTPAWVCSTDPLPDPHGRAKAFLDFAALLKHPKSDQPDKRLVLAPFWQRICTAIYGPSDDQGRRLIRTAFIFIPRGARKSATAGVIALAHTVGPFRTPNALVVSAGADREQAGLAFGEAASILRMDDVLSPRAKIREWEHRIRHVKSGAEYLAVSADADAQLGKSPSVVIADELCAAWRGRQAVDLWGALATGAAKVPDSLIIIITTAGDGRDQALGVDLYKYACRVARGEVKEPSFLPVIFEAPADLPWDNEATWHIANPGLKDGFPDIVALRNSARQAKELPSFRRQFETLHLNRMQDGSTSGWVDMDVGDEGGAPINLEALAGRECFVGIDLSKSFDLTAIVAAFRDDDGGYTLLTWCFLPEVTIRRRAMESGVPWREWQEVEHIISIPGAVIDDDVIEAKLREIGDTYAVREFAADPKFAVRILKRMTDDGYPMVEHAQSALHTTVGINEFQRAILSRKLRHGAHPVLRWCISNAVPVTNDTGLVRLSKSKSADSIDAAQACAMAIGRAAQQEPVVVDIYDDPNFRPDMVWF